MHRFSKKTKPLHAMLAAAVLAVAVMPLAVAGATGTGATTSKVTDAKFKKLKQRIAALEAQGPSAPSGPAGGDLAGDYPNPQIGENAVGTDEVAADSLGAADLANASVGSLETAPDSVGLSEIVSDGVGGDELKGAVLHVSEAPAGSNNTFVENTVDCASGEVLLGGGYAWQNGDATVSMTVSAPADADTWSVRGRSSTSNNLFAWVTCLAV